MTICTEDGCDKPAKGRGLCKTHWARARRSGTIVPDPSWHRLSEVDTEAATAVCSVCGPTKIRVRGDGRGNSCITRMAADIAAFRDRSHGLTLDEKRAMLEAQGGGCAICGELRPPMAVDHDHSCCPGTQSCGKCVRGILCRSCNSGIGMLGDSAERVAAALAYLTSAKR